MPATAAIRAGAAYVELFVRDNRFVRGLEAASAKLKAFGASITAIGAKLTGLSAAAFTPLLGAVKLFTDAGSQLQNLSQQTGMSVEALSELAYAADQSGTNLDELVAGLRSMTKLIVEAARGSQEAQKVLARLGLSINDLNQMSPDEQFEIIAARLAAIENPAVRAALAIELFGRNGAKLLPLISAGSQGIRELRAEAARLGLTMSSESAQAAEEFGNALSTLWRVIKSVLTTIGGALAPTLKTIAQWITRAGVSVGQWIASHRELITVVAGAIGAVAGLGAALTVLGTVFSGVGSLISGVVSGLTLAAGAVKLLAAAIAFVLSPLGLLIAGFGTLVGVVLTSTAEGQRALQNLGQGFTDLQDVAATAWQGISDALKAADIPAAMEIAWLGLKTAWETGLAAIRQSWREFKSWFVELFWDAVYSVAQFFNTAWTGIETTFWQVVNALADGWDWFVNLLTIGFAEFVGFFRRAWARVRNIFNKEAAQREVEAINREIEAQKEAARAKLHERAQERQQRVVEAEEAGRQRAEALAAMHEEERRQRRQEIEEANAADQARVEAAKEALRARVAELEAIRQQQQEQQQQEAQRPRRPEFDLSGLDEAVQQVQAKGTFNVFALPGMGADTLAERTAKATEEIARGVNQLVREAQKGGIVFS